MRTLADRNAIDGLIAGLGDVVRRWMAEHRDGHDWALVGIRSRGDLIAKRLAEHLRKQPTDAVGDLQVGTLDITLYRDDLSEIGPQPVVRTTEVPFAIDGLHVVLIDDVLMTGRSVRAALQSLMDLGRPKRVWLMVLVDRGGRELPIAPDAVGMDLTDVSSGERVHVMLRPTDDQDAIVVEAAQAVAGR